MSQMQTLQDPYDSTPVEGAWAEPNGDPYPIEPHAAGQQNMRPYGEVAPDAASVPFYQTNAFKMAMWVAGIAGGASGAYHGYKRHNGSILWALGWGFMGTIFPVFTIPLSLAEGFGKPASK